MRDTLTLYFVRHGETDWNRTLRYQGQSDVPLNDTGRAQARRNGAALAAHLADPAAFDYVASPLGRTRETMRIVRAALSQPPGAFVTDARLLELNYGVWQGQLSADLPRTDPEGVAWRHADPVNWRAAGGESYAELTARVLDWLAGVERDTIVVSHGGVSRVLRGHLLGLDPTAVPFLDVPQDKVMVIGRGRLEWV